MHTKIPYLALAAALAIVSDRAEAQTWQNITSHVPAVLSTQNIHPMASDGTRLYVLGKTGVLVSSDGGASFSAINAVSGASYSLDQDQHLWIKWVNGEIWLGSSPGSFAMAGNGGHATLHRLTPGSTTWTQSSASGYVAGDLGNQALGMAYDAVHASYISMNAFGVIRTSGDGTHWTQAASSPAGIGSALSIETLGGTAFTARPTARVWKSADGGDNWSETQSFPTGGVAGHLLALDGRLMASYSGANTTLDAFYFSDDLGETWTKVPGLKGTWALSTDGSRVYASRGGLPQFSVNRGTTWDPLPTAGLPAGYETIYCLPHDDQLFLLGRELDGASQWVPTLYSLDVASIDFTPSTQIAVQPSGKGLLVGQSHTLSVISGGQNLSYQWRFEGADIPGATASSYTVSDAQLANSGNYTVFISGDKGDATSEPVLIEVVDRLHGRIDITYDKYAPSIADFWRTTYGGTIHVLADHTLLTVTGAVLRTFNTDMKLEARADLGSVNYYLSSLDSAGRLILGGIVSGSNHRIVRVNPQTLEVDASFPTVPVVGTIQGLLELPGRGYLLTGSMTAVNGMAVNQIALINYQGALDTSFAIGQTPNAGLSGATLSTAGDLYIFGAFNTWNGSNYQGLVRLDANGLLDPTFNNPSLPRPTALFALQDGRLLATSGLGSVRNLFAIQPNGALDATFNTADAKTGRIYGFAQQLDGKIVIGGDFTFYNGTSVAKYQRLNLDGTLDTSFYAETGFSHGDVVSVGYDPAGFVYLSGSNTLSTFQGRDGYGKGPVRLFTEITDLGIFRQSRSQKVDQNGNVTLSVLAVGTSALSYQWFKDGEPLTGANSSTLTISNYQAVNNGSYTVEVTNGSGSVTNDPIHLTARSAPSIVIQPAPTDALLGGSANLFVLTEGAGNLTYQWRKDGEDIPGATIATLTLGPLAFTDAGDYSVIISNTLGSIESSVAPLTVNEITGKPLPGFNAAALDNIVRKLAVFPDNSALLGGTFTVAGGQLRNWFTRMSTTGGLVPGWIGPSPGGITGGIGVYEVAVLADGRAIVAGQFTGVQGVSQTSIARIKDDGTLDDTFPVTSGPNSSIETVAELPNGQLLLGGTFNLWTGSSQSYLVRMNSNGTLDHSFTLIPNDWVHVIKVLDDGRAYVAGRFTQLGGAAYSRIARLNADGTIDNTFTPAAISGEIYAMDVDNDGKIVIGGGFTSIGGISRPRLARLETNGALDTDFAPSSTTFNNTVFAVDVQLNGKIVVGGKFNAFLVRLLPDATPDPYFQMNAGPNSTVQDVQTTPDGILWVGGIFTYIGGKAHKYVTALTTDKVDLAVLQRPRSIAVDLNGDASFTVTIHSTSPATYQWLKNGSAISGATDATLNLAHVTRADAGNYSVRVVNGSRTVTTAAARLTVRAEPVLAAQPQPQAVAQGGNATFAVDAIGLGTLSYQWRKNGVDIGGANDANLTVSNTQLSDAGVYDVVVSNALGTITSQPAGLSAYVLTGGVDPGFNPGTGANGSVNIATVLPNGNIAIGGGFSSFNGQTRGRFALLDATGALINLTANPSLASQVNGIAVQNDGKLIVAGFFGIKRFNADGTADNTFASNTDQIDAIAVRGNTLYVVGYFGNSMNNIRKYSLVDGSVIASFQANATGVQGKSLVSVHIQSDNRVLVGSTFGNIMRLNEDGTWDGSFTGPTFAYSGGGSLKNIYAITQTADGMIWVGGHFTSVNGNDRQYLARLTAAGALDETVGNVAINEDVRSLVALGNDVVVGGAFSKMVGGQNFKYLLKVSGIDGAVDSSFGPVGFNSSVLAMTMQGDGKMLVGGNFTVPSSRISRIVAQFGGGLNIVSQPASVAVVAGDAAAFTVGWTGGGTATYQWKKDGSPIPGATAQSLVFSAATSGDAGSYSVTITVGGQSQTSSPATLTVGGGGTNDTFAGWKSQFGFPPGLDNPEDDADNDGLPNAIEYKFGSDPTDAGSSEHPLATQVEANGQTYPAVTFVQNQAAIGATLVVKVSTTLGFLDSLGFTQVAVVDLGNGTERVTLRSNASMAEQTKQFIKVGVTIP